MKTQTEILDDLDLLYEKNQLPTIESSVEPNGGVLNLDKALADNPECWDTIAINSAQLEKKNHHYQMQLERNHRKSLFETTDYKKITR